MSLFTVLFTVLVHAECDPLISVTLIPSQQKQNFTSPLPDPGQEHILSVSTIYSLVKHLPQGPGAGAQLEHAEQKSQWRGQERPAYLPRLELVL